MFLSSKALIMIIAMYSLSGMLLVFQYTIGDVFGITLTDINGNPVKNTIIQETNVARLNTFQANVTNTNPAIVFVNSLTQNASLLWQLFQLATGTFIFNVLILFGVPAIMVSALTIVYFILLMVLVVSGVFRFPI